MAEYHPNSTQGFTVQSDQPLIGIISESDGHEVVQYFTDEDAADAATLPDSIQRALSLAGAWSDLDWEEMEAALDRIRHESQSTPPITDL